MLFSICLIFSYFIRENENVAEETLCHELRGELIDRIDAEKTSIVGPALKSREEMVKIVLGDENLGQFMQRTATETGKDYDDIAKEVGVSEDEVPVLFKNATGKDMPEPLLVIGHDDEIKAIQEAISLGKHVLIHGKPGTTKTASAKKGNIK